MQRTLKSMTLSALLLTLLACASGPSPGIRADTTDDAAAVQDAPDLAETAGEAMQQPDVLAPGAWLPASIQALYGFWVHDDGVTVRALALAGLDNQHQDLLGKSPTYILFKYAAGQMPVEVQRGEVALKMGPALRMTPVWSLDGNLEASNLAFLPAQKDEIILATEKGTQFGYARAASLP